MFRLFFLLFVSFLYAAAPQMISRDYSKRILFENPDIKTSYSALMAEKNAKADSLLPALNGDMALAELLRANPGLWSIENLRKEKNLSTKLNVNIIYIDGIREESFCDFSKTTDAKNWELSIGVDFVSGGSNIVGIHVQQCINQVKDAFGYATVDDEGRTLIVPPKKILEDIEKSQIPDAIPIDLQVTLLKAHQGVELTGECPGDIEAYLILLKVWDMVKNIELDISTINEALSSVTLKSCAFSREWNKKYSETASFSCDSRDICTYNQSEDGKTQWGWNGYDSRFEYERKQFWKFKYGKKSIHEGGTMLDLRITPLSTRLFLESYLDLKGEPVSLGLIIIGEN